MPYTKTLTGGKKEIYQIKTIQISLTEKQVQGEIDHIDYDDSQNPKVKKINFNITNQNERILDPTWSSQSNPPKPTGFVYSNPDTWVNLTTDQIPFISDPAKQYFDKLIAKSGNTGTTIYAKIKNTLYEILKEIGTIPDGSGWSVS